MARHNVARRPRGVSRRSMLRTVGAAGLAGAAGCLSDVGGAGEDDTVTYGVVSPMSGAYSSLGPNQRRGAQLAVRTLQESDEFDYEVEAVYEDTETTSEAATSQATKVIEQDGANYLMGAISSSVAIALNSLAVDEEVVYNPGAAAVPITGEECNEFVFRAETNTAQIAEAISEFTVEELGSKVWFHIADYAYGESVLTRTRARMEEANPDVEVVGTSRSNLGASNYDTFVSDIGNSDAEVAVLGMTGGDLINFVNQAAGQGLKEDVTLVSPTMTFAVVRGALGEAAYGTYGGVRYLPSLENESNREFVDAYTDEYDEPPDNFARVGYQSILMTAEGVRAAGTADPVEVKDELAGLEVDTILGPNQFRDCDQQALNPTWAGELVEPDSGSTAAVELLDEVSGEDAALPCEETGCRL